MSGSLNDIESQKTMRDTIEIAHDAAYSAFCGGAFAIPLTAAIMIFLVVAPEVYVPSVEILALVGISIWALLAIFIASVVAIRS